MQFDAAMSGGDKTHFEKMKEMFHSIECEMPIVIFWNLRGATSDFPVTCDEKGVVLLSGYSPALLSCIIDGVDISPLTMMFKVIHAARYDLVSL